MMPKLFFKRLTKWKIAYIYWQRREKEDVNNWTQKWKWGHYCQVEQNEKDYKKIPWKTVLPQTS